MKAGHVNLEPHGAAADEKGVKRDVMFLAGPLMLGPPLKSSRRLAVVCGRTPLGELRSKCDARSSGTRLADGRCFDLPAIRVGEPML